jgi:hypothetical protein
MYKQQIASAVGDDLLDGFAFYEQREAGVGDYFFAVSCV